MDTMTSAIVKGEHIYGVAAVTTAMVDEARRRHGAAPTAAAALGRLLTGGALIGSLLKEPGHRVTLQIVSKGPVRSIVVEANGAGHVRGYMGQPAVHLPSRQGKLDVGGAVGKGILHVIRDTGFGEPYSGTVPLASGEIAEDLAAYFFQSEQMPSAVSLGVFVQTDQTVTASGGFLIQFHATIAEELTDHIERALASVPPVTTMIHEGCAPHDILLRALGGLALEDVKHSTPHWQCRCSRDRVVQTLIALGEQELRQMIAEQDETQVRCEFCTDEYVFSQQDMQHMLETALS